jgi:hypothetical protein
MTKHPSVRAVPVDGLVEVYGATYFRPALARFIALAHNPNLSRAQLEAKLRSIRMSFHPVPVWHRIKYLREDPVSMATITADSIHVRPPTIDGRGHTIPGHKSLNPRTHDSTFRTAKASCWQTGVNKGDEILWR